MPQHSRASVVLSLVGGLLLFLLALAAVWLCLRWLGRHYGNPAASGGSMRVLERLALGPDRALVVVRTKQQVLLLGVTAQHIELLTQLDAADYPAPPPDEGGKGGAFSAALQQALQGFTGTRKRESGKDENG